MTNNQSLGFSVKPGKYLQEEYALLNEYEPITIKDLNDAAKADIFALCTRFALNEQDGERLNLYLLALANSAARVASRPLTTDNGYYFQDIEEDCARLDAYQETVKSILAVADVMASEDLLKSLPSEKLAKLNNTLAYAKRLLPPEIAKVFDEFLFVDDNNTASAALSLYALAFAGGIVTNLQHKQLREKVSDFSET